VEVDVMQINVSQLLKGSIGESRNYKVSAVVDINNDGNGRQVKGEVKLLRTQRGVLVKGELATEVGLICSRCLNKFDCPVTLSIEEEYIPTIDVVSGLPAASPEEPGLFTIDEHHVIDLTEAIRQYALLAIPMKPLCREDCAGLCQICSHNLNQGPCDCPPRVAGQRRSELSKSN
jgi:uncharacterized protein